MNRIATVFAVVTLLAAAAAQAAGPRTTVCTITVNSPDERDAFQRHLPADRFDFVELVERGRPDWLASSCRKGVRCDVLVVSGHFAGTEFYSSRFDATETLPVDEIERASCSQSCPGLFEDLKEVYLFGCDTLNPTPVRAVTPEMVASLVREGGNPADARRLAQALADRHNGSAQEQMRRLFARTPVIYGFTAKAPYGRVAGPMLERYFGGEADSLIGSGRVDERLAHLFAPTNMMVTTGLQPTEPNADYREESCTYHDDRRTAAEKLASIHAILARSMAEARVWLDRIEKFVASVGPETRAQPGYVKVLGDLARDNATRARYIGLVRDTPDPAVRMRLIALAGSLGWLDAEGRRDETLHMVGELLATPSTGFGEVDLICSLNKDRSLDGGLARLRQVSRHAGRAADAALACLGNAPSRARIVRALASSDEGDVQLAQAYLRHHPITNAAELRTVALDIAKMEGSAAQARALETLARHHIADDDVLRRLVMEFRKTRSLAVQRAIAEVFIRADYRAADLAPALKQHRLRSNGGADVIDVLIERLESPRG